MKAYNLFIFLIGFQISSISLACDSYLLNSTSSVTNPKYIQLDCEFQDRYKNVKSIFGRYGRNIENVTEYRALRFINQFDYLKNLNSKKLSPIHIYEPAPETWQIWSNGIEEVLKNFSGQNVLLNQNTITAENIGQMNKLLMENNGVTLKDKNISSKAAIGQYRTYADNSAGYCMKTNATEDKKNIVLAQNSISAFQSAFEKYTKKSFSNFIQDNNGLWADVATMNPMMNIRDFACGDQLNQSFLYYTPGHMVVSQVNWVQLFVDEVIKSYKKNQPILAPTELSAIVQKWLVSIHPFVDGNGRTSRAVQDVISKSFSLPYVPAGTLQNDALEKVDTYVENTYRETEKMLSFLEDCAQKLSSGIALDYRCKSIEEN